MVTLLDFVTAYAQSEQLAYAFVRDGVNVVEQMTYQQVAVKAHSVAAMLQAKMAPGERVLLLFKPGLSFISAFLGCLFAGVIAVPAYPPRQNRAGDRVRGIILNAQPRLVLTSAELIPSIEKFFASNETLPSLSCYGVDEIPESLALSWQAFIPEPDTLAFLQYTSGSTSAPKGVMVSHGNLLTNLSDIDTAYHHTKDSIMVSWLPTFHDLGLIYGVLEPLYKGFPAYLMAPEEFVRKPFSWLQAIAHFRGTHSVAPNFAYDLCTRVIPDEQVATLDLSSWVLAVSAAEPIRRDTVERFIQRYRSQGFRSNVFSFAFGLAESTLKTTTVPQGQEPEFWQLQAAALEEGRVVRTRLDDPGSRGIASCGYPGEQTKLAIVNPQTHQRCSPNEVGEIWVHSPSVAQGYWQQPEVTQEMFQARLPDEGERLFLRTGDLGFMDRGRLFVTGRLKELIIIEGRNHYPQDIEATVQQCSPLFRAGQGAAFSIPSGHGERLVIVQELIRHHSQLDRNQVFKDVRQAVAEVHGLDVEAIVLIRFGSLPVTSSGKIQRRAAREDFLASRLQIIASWQRPLQPSVQPEQLPIHTVKSWVAQQFAHRLGVAVHDLQWDEQLSNYGFDSSIAIQLAADIEAQYGYVFAPMLFYEYTTLAAIARYLASPQISRNCPIVIKQPDPDHDAIAIIGMGCRFPGAADLQAFWQFLLTGQDGIQPIPRERQEFHAFFSSAAVAKMPQQGGFLEGIDQFDPSCFRLSPREADLLDPQQRLFLEVSWEALESVGRTPEFWESQAVGVFVGISSSDYAHLLQQANCMEAQVPTGNAHCMVANRLSYLYGWQGPSLAIDTACSSSLVAIHQACQSLRRGECKTAVAGGVNLILSPHLTVAFHQAGMLSPDSRCKVFDHRANGYVRGEGCGVVILKPLAAAQRDGDHIWAVIRGTAVNQDGCSNGITSPNGQAQEAVIQSALQDAGVDPGVISYVEAHGTGTSLGDPIEVKALTNVLNQTPSRVHPCVVGSVKTNIGHLEAAAGIAGVIKTVLALQAKQIPPNLHWEQLNPLLAKDATQFHFPVSPMPWQPIVGRWLAGVSSFGFGGTNAHIILEAATEVGVMFPTDSASTQLLCLSAQSQPALMEVARRWQGFIRNHAAVGASEIAYHSHIARPHLRHRLVIVARSPLEWVETLDQYLQQKPAPVYEGKLTGNAPSVAFWFVAPETQTVMPNFASLNRFPVFQQALEDCERWLRTSGDYSVSKALFSDRSDASAQARLTFPIWFACSYAFAKLYQSWGIVPQIVLGEQLGEVMAATVAGVFSLKDGLKIAVLYGQIKQAQADGQTHSDRLAHLSSFLRSSQLQAPTIPVMSSVTASWLESARDPAYWQQSLFLSQQSEERIRFLQQAGCDLRIEIKPHAGLNPLTVVSVADPSGARPASSPAFPQQEPAEDGIQSLLNTLAALYSKGIPIDWPAVHVNERHPYLALPTYPFQRQRCWYDQGSNHQSATTTAAPTINQSSKSATSTEATLTINEYSSKDLEHSGNGKQHSTSEATSETILSQLTEIVGHLLRINPLELDVHERFIEMGADSIVLATTLRRIEETFNFKLSFKQLFEETPNLTSLAHYIAQRLPQQSSSQSSLLELNSSPAVLPVAGENPLSKNGSLPPSQVGKTAFPTHLPEELQILLRREREAVEALLAQHQALYEKLLTLGGVQSAGTIAPTPMVNNPLLPQAAPTLPPWRPTSLTSEHLKSQQQQHLDALIARYTAKTSKSKQLAAKFREHLADNRASAGFRPSIKEMLYPLVCERAQGVNIWDVDGNKYLDLTMGFGVYLFGHAPSFVVSAIQEQMERGFSLGPQTHLAGEVAELLCTLTGMERVLLCNTGTEAVMTALRLARAVTGRNRIALFEGAYHGHFDGVLATAQQTGQQLKATPLSPGTPSSLVEEVLSLPYDHQQALEMIRAEGSRLAAVLVEPVQSRRPDLQPQEFLQQLREITTETGTLLIFDEMITGFRIGAGGAQAYFRVQADLATYGKIIGGGMPIGAVAGKRSVMDAVDGGMWHYGDDSYPQAETIFFAGTFNKHPLAMAAARAVLRHLQAEGEQLYADLNVRTARLVARLNQLFTESGVAIRVAHFGSLFRFVFSRNQDIFIYHLLEKGIFIWEGRNCFLSTAHADEDVDFIVKVVAETIHEMQKAEFFGPSASSTSPAVSSPIRVPTPFPLSLAQRQLYLLARLNPTASVAYHESFVLRFTGRLDRAALQSALSATIQKHEALRTIIAADGRQQWVLELFTPELTVISPGSDPVEAALQSAIAQPFEFGQAPLVRAVLFEQSPVVNYFLLCAHHLVVDGWSIGLILKDLGHFYTLVAQGEMPTVTPAPGFRAFLTRQEQYSRTTESAEYLNFWLQRLTSAVAPLDLPLDHPRPALPSFKGGAINAPLNRSLVEALKDRAKQSQITFYMMVLAGYALWLHRLSNQKDVVVGIPVSGRPQDEDAPVVGYCTHMLPFQSQFHRHLSIREYLERFRTDLLACYEHQDLPFAQLLEALKLPFNPSRPPLFAATFNLDRGESLTRLFPLDVDFVNSPVSYTKFELGVNITQVGQDYHLRLEYATDLWDNTTAQRFFNQYLTVLESLAMDPEQKLGALSLISSADHQRWFVERNATEMQLPGYKTIVDWVVAQAQYRASETAVVFADQSLSYHQLETKTNQLAHYLHRRGVGAETPVGICLLPGLTLPVALLGVLQAGGFYVPLDPEYPLPRLQKIVEDSQIRIVLTHSQHRSLWAGMDVTMVCLDEESGAIAAEDKAPLSLGVLPQQLAYTIYTSGSTGKPKGVSISHQALVNHLGAMAEELAFQPQDVWFSVTTLSFDIAGLEIFLPLTQGGRVILTSGSVKRDGQQLAQAMQNSQATFMQATPATWKLLLRSGWTGQAGLKILCGGEALPSELAQQLIRLNGGVWNLYGPTETTIWSAFRRIDHTNQAIDLGMPIANTRLYVVDADLNPLPLGVAGELAIAGLGLARGYWGRPDLTAGRFVPNPFATQPGERLYLTGDLVRYGEDDRLEFLERIDQQVKVNGYRIELDEIRTVLRQHPAVDDAVAIATSDVAGDGHLVAYLVPKSGVLARDGALEPELRQLLQAALPAYMSPSHFHWLEQMPLTPNGKLDRNALLSLKATRVASETPLIKPENPHEITLSKIWQEVLDREQVGVSENFFDLGGTSLALARVHAQIQAAIQREFPLVDCVKFPTIRSLAAHLNAHAQPASQPAEDDSLKSAYHRAQLRRNRLQ